MSSPPNLDRLAAQHAQNIIARTADKKSSDVDNSVTKTLGVLQEDGVYACFLFLKAKEKEIGDVVADEMLKLLDDLGFGWGMPVNSSSEATLKHVTAKITADLERLILSKETLEQMLIYARYGAKARS